MKFDVLHNFISPVTGRILSDPDYVLIGNRIGIAIPSPIVIDLRLDLINLRHAFDELEASSFILGFPNSDLVNAQALSSLANGFMVNTNGIVSTTSVIPIGGLPDLAANNLWIGDVSNRPVAYATIGINNLPNLTHKYIFRGDESNRPIAVNDLTVVENDLSSTIQNLLDLAQTVQSLAETVEALTNIVNVVQAGAIATLQAEVLILQGQVIGLIAALAALRLNNIVADGDVSFYNYKLINLANPTNPTDGVNLQSMQTAIANLRLTSIPAGGNVSMGNFRITNLQQSPDQDFDAISATFLWDLMHDKVEILWP